MIEDDGVGFNLRTVNRESHYGLQMLLERVEACGGMAAVDSEVGLGTRVVAVIPCEIKSDYGHKKRARGVPEPFFERLKL